MSNNRNGNQNAPVETQPTDDDTLATSSEPEQESEMLRTPSPSTASNPKIKNN